VGGHGERKRHRAHYQSLPPGIGDSGPAMSIIADQSMQDLRNQDKQRLRENAQSMIEGHQV